MAKSFYGGVFGWDMEDADAGGGAVYTMCRLDGDAVAGLYEMPETMRATGVPPTWTSYVTVDDADAAAARVAAAGGNVVDPAFDVLDVGRMAVLADPQGAVLAVWQPRSRIGAERVNDVGCLCVNELATPDMEAARAFYERVFGWTTDGSAGAPHRPSMVFNGGNINAAFFTAANGTAPHWRPCFTVESTERAVDRVLELGGKMLQAPVDIGHGSIAMVRDPQGALFTIFAGETHP